MIMRMTRARRFVLEILTEVPEQRGDKDVIQKAADAFSDSVLKRLKHRSRTNAVLRDCARAGWLERTGTTRKPVYALTDAGRRALEASGPVEDSRRSETSSR
jgi:DNA-binding PadR family transcriptional regulator